jgi:hypothetical protein
VTTLPRPYQLLAEIVSTFDGLSHANDRDKCQELAVQLAIELWRAGMTEKRAGMSTNESDYDAPLWCKGMFLEEVTAAVGVPTVAASDPMRDLGRNR